MITFFRKKFARLSGFCGKKRIKIQRILFKQAKRAHFEGLLKNSFFYFGVGFFILLGLLFSHSNSLAKPNYVNSSDIILFNTFFKNTDNLGNSDLFFGNNKGLALETPDLKIIQDNSISAVSTPGIQTTQTLGHIFGGQAEQRKDVIDYVVLTGDTIKLLAEKFGISENTIAWANDISKNSTLKADQSITILPVSGVLHIVKNGDTISQISRTYKSEIDDIVASNNLVSEGDIFIGDVLVIPYGVKPAKPAPSVQVVLPNTFFIYPTEGKITQGLHYYNAIDVANSCGTPINAVAGGIVQKARTDYRYGNYITILHDNGTSTYYGHLQNIMFVKPGQRIETGYRIASMGSTGTSSTGCHLHFGVTGARNPLNGLKSIKYK